MDPHGARVAVDVIDAGFVQPLQDTTRYRPVPGGCSIGNLTRINAGTLGGWACDDADDSIVFLTNNHVVTATNNRQAIPTPSGVLGSAQRSMVIVAAISPTSAAALSVSRPGS